MRAILLGFALGVWYLQQQACLPDLSAWLACCGLLVIAVAVGIFKPR